MRHVLDDFCEVGAEVSKKETVRCRPEEDTDANEEDAESRNVDIVNNDVDGTGTMLEGFTFSDELTKANPLTQTDSEGFRDRMITY